MAKATRGFDAGREHLGHVYGQALLGAAEKAGITEQVLGELDSLVNDVFDKLTSFRDALSAPKVSPEDKERLIERALAPQASRLLVNALKVMARHGRFDCVPAVRDSYRKLYNELRNRVEVNVRTAVPLNDAQLAQIAERLRLMLKKEVDLTVEIHPEILGGIIVKVGDTLLDGSVKARLEQMRVQAITSTERQLRESFDRFVAV